MLGQLGIGWAIVCISGMEGFKEEVLPKLRDNYLSGNSAADDTIMVWLPDVDKLRSLKWAVGSKIILKYRLHFHTSRSPNPGNPGKNVTVFSTVDGQMENPMVVW